MKFPSLFRKQPQEKPKELPADEVAYSEDGMHNYGDMPKYNPDDLIGKKGAAIYRKMMLDEQVKAVVRFKRDAITSRKWFFEVDKDALSETEAARRVAVAEKIFNEAKGSITDDLNGILSSMYQGFSMTEKVFAQIECEGKTYWGLKALKLRPFDTFEFKVDEHGNTLKLTQRVGDKELEVDIEKFIHFTHNPEYDEHYGQSELREAYRPWFSKDMAIRFWNMWLERHASGFKTLSPTGGKTLTAGSAEYESLKKVLNNTVNGAGMILPSNMELNVVFPANNVAFKEAIEFHDLGIAKALLVPNLMGITPSGQTGSYSQSDTHLTAFAWTINADTKRLEETINEQLMKQLGEINFNDEYWPRFKFQPMSDKEIDQLINTWATMLEKAGVTHSESDEAYVRELLGFPEKSEDAEDNDEDENDDSEAAGGKKGVSKDDVPNGSDGGKDGKGEDENLPDETIAGKSANVVYAQFAKDKAAKRVDALVLGKASEVLEKEHADNIAFAVYTLTKEWIERYQEAALDWTPETVAKQVKALRFNPKLVAKVQRTVSALFKEGWKLGQRHAETEIDKAKRTAFSMQYNAERITLISEEFFKNKSFKVAGDLTNDAKAQIDTIIINGAKTDKTVSEIEQEIYSSFATKGLLAEDVMPLLAEALAGKNIVNPQARIDTMVRTNLFETINEARYSYFTDPALDGFVEALEYSAILDGRTTQICSHLDGHVHPADSEVWQQYRPPNHYNCRSLLIPVTAVDKWTESELPNIDPQEGFA